MERRVAMKSLAMAIPFALLTACGGDAPEPQPATSGTGSSPAPAAPAEAPAADLVAMGQEVYHGAGICFTCHGPNGAGTQLGPNLNDGEWLWIDNPEDNLQQKLADQIRAGTPNPKEYPAPMPPMGGANLSEDQLQAVAAYVASLSQG